MVLIMLFIPQTVAMATGGDLPPWDRNNPREQDVPIISDKGPPKHIYDVIRDKAPELVQTLDPSHLWLHLIRLQFIDNTTREEIEVSTDYLCTLLHTRMFISILHPLIRYSLTNIKGLKKVINQQQFVLIF